MEIDSNLLKVISTFLIAERNSPSDEVLYIISITNQSSEYINNGATVFEVEGAKAIFEIVSPESGYFYSLVENGSTVKIGELLGWVSKVKLDKEQVRYITGEIQQNLTGNSDSISIQARFSKPAIEFIESTKVDIATIKNLLPAFGLITVEHIKNSVSQLLAVESRFMQRTSISNLQNWKSKLYELSSSEPVILIGAGNGAIQVLDILVKINKYNPVGYFSDEPENILDSLEIMNYGNTSVENISEIAKRLEVKKLIITVGLSPLFRYNCSMLDGLNGLELVTLIHPDTIIGTNVEIGAGTVIFGNVHIGAETKIGKACFISSGSTIEHHNSIGAGFCCGPMFATSGLVTIGEKTKAGMGVCIEPGINIGNEVILASKTLITKNIIDGVTVKSIF